MRVLIFTETEIWGGLETHAITLARALDANGDKATIVCIGRRTFELYRRIGPEDTALLELTPPVRRTMWGWWRTLRSVEGDAAVLEKGTLWTGGLPLDLALRLRYDRYAAIQQLEPPQLPARSSKRYVFQLVPGPSLWWWRWKWAGYARSLAPRPTICVSDAVRRRLIQDYDFSPSKLVTVHNGVDSAFFGTEPDARERMAARWDVPIDAMIFGSIGRLSPQKGLDTAVAAFAQAVHSAAGRSLYLVLVGEGPERESLLEQSRALGVSHLVRLPGFMSRPHDAYQAFDVFLIPSRHEGLPFALVEAMASGCQIIGAAVGGIPEVITDETFGTLVPPENPEELARAMIKTIEAEPGTREAARVAARRRVLEAFDARTQSLKIARILSNSA